MSSARAIVDAEVRELVRRRGIDPLSDPGAVTQLIDEVVGDYLDRAAASTMPALLDTPGLSRAVLDSVAGFGPLQPLLDDPTIDDYRAQRP